MTGHRLKSTTYDRTQCDIGIVHIGFGAFHRAHQAVYIDDYMQATGDLRWGIAAVNLRASESAAFRQAAMGRDGYLLKAISPDGEAEFRSVRSHVAFFDAAQDMNGALDLFTRASVKAATITVTESGYAFTDDWRLDLAAPAIATEIDGGPVKTIYGYLTQGLAWRAAQLDTPISLMCCDNIRSNGKVLKGALLSYMTALGKADLADWTRKNVSFPCSMVDRITPRSTPALRAEVDAIWPGEGAAAIHAEDFLQWVLEDEFAADMPDLGRAGVQIVKDVLPYEEAKIRILNGGHTGLAYLGALAGHVTFDAAMRDAAPRKHFETWERDEVLPGLGDDIPFDTSAYLDEIARRFENPGIADQLERICMDGYSKMGIFIRPTLEACLSKGITPRAGYDCAASWVVYARKVQANTTTIPYHDPFWDTLVPMLAKGQETDIAQDSSLWGDLPQRFDTFVPDLVAAIHRMEDQWQD
ncbi:mannitol dehydrogenase family protein [Yoonia sp. 2307UL14-13]|uniref:mannitol dehydrogenase family protein n=1 Tax=Yoonia sp. 2307UL14-13 TaxID=3126506 RepID=UPI0030B1F9D5